MGLRCAAIQFAPKFKAPRENLAKLSKLIVQAASSGAKLIVCPELCTTGYSFLSTKEAAPFAESLELPEGPFQPHLSMHVMPFLAKRFGVAIVWGYIRLGEDGQLYNSQAYVDQTGHLDGYDKICPWGNDYIWTRPGEGNPPIVRAKINGKEWKIGLLICRDVRDKKDDKGPSFYEKGDADIVAFSANWGDGGFPAVAWMDFVKDNETTLIVSNRYGKEVPNNFGEGGVCVIHPDGRVHCEGLVWNQDCIVYAEVE